MYLKTAVLTMMCPRLPATTGHFDVESIPASSGPASHLPPDGPGHMSQCFGQRTRFARLAADFSKSGQKARHSHILVALSISIVCCGGVVVTLGTWSPLQSVVMPLRIPPPASVHHKPGSVNSRRGYTSHIGLLVGCWWLGKHTRNRLRGDC